MAVSVDDIASKEKKRGEKSVSLSQPSFCDIVHLVAKSGTVFFLQIWTFSG